MSSDMENRTENNFLASEHEREQLYNRIAELEQRVKVLTDALRLIMDDQHAEENRYVFLTAKQALNQTPQQTAAQIERGHIEWIMKLPVIHEVTAYSQTALGLECAVNTNLVAIPPLPKESKE